MKFTPSLGTFIAYILVTAVTIPALPSPTSVKESALKTIRSDFVQKVIIDSAVGQAMAKTGVWLSKTRVAAPIISYGSGLLEATGVGVVGTATFIAGYALSAGTFFYGPIAGINNLSRLQEQKNKDYYLRLWGQHLRQIQTKADVDELQKIFLEAAELAGTSYGNYVEKNKLNWCGKNGPNCKLNFSNLFISPVVDSRLISIKNFNKNLNVWEISADVVFPYNPQDHQQKVFDIAVELLRMASFYDYDGMKRKIENDLMIRDGDWLSGSRCQRDPAKTVMAYMILGKSLPNDFLKVCKLSPKVDEIKGLDQGFLNYAFQDIDVMKNTMEYRALSIPQFNYKTIGRGSSDDKSSDRACTMQTVSEKFPGGDMKRFFHDTHIGARNYLLNFVKEHGMNWCQGAGTQNCSHSYESMQLADISTVTPMTEKVNSKNEIIWKIPYKIFCGYQSKMRQDYIDYLTLELLRKTPSPENFKLVYDSAQELKNSARFKNKLPCDESANTMLGLYMMNRPVNLEYMATLCQGRPLPPPSNYDEKIYRNDNSTRFQTIVQDDYSQNPLFASCGPNEIQNLFLAELPPCEIMSLVPLKIALNMYSDEVSRQIGQNKHPIAAEGDKLLTGTEKMFFPMLAYTIAHKMANRYIPIGPKRMVNVVMSLSMSALSRYYSPFKSARLGYGLSREIIQAAYGTIAGAVAFEGVRQLGLYFDLEKYFPQDTLEKAFAGDMSARRELRSNLTATFELNANGNMLDDEAFNKIMYFLAKNNSAGYRYVQLVEQQKNHK